MPHMSKSYIIDLSDSHKKYMGKYLHIIIDGYNLQANEYTFDAFHKHFSMVLMTKYVRKIGLHIFYSSDHSKSI